MGEEPATVVEHVDHARLIVDDDDRRRAQAQAADLAGPTEISGVSSSAAVMKPMLMPPGTTAFALRPFHTPPPCSSISSRTVTPSGNSKQPGLFTWPLTQYSFGP